MTQGYVRGKHAYNIKTFCKSEIISIKAVLLQLKTSHFLFTLLAKSVIIAFTVI